MFDTFGWTGSSDYYDNFKYVTLIFYVIIWSILNKMNCLTHLKNVLINLIMWSNPNNIVVILLKYLLYFNKNIVVVVKLLPCYNSGSNSLVLLVIVRQTDVLKSAYWYIKSFFRIVGEKCDIKLEVYVDKKSACKMNSGQDQLYDILVLHLEGGKDIFITVTGIFRINKYIISY